MNARLLDTNIVSFMIRRHTLRRSYRKHLIGYVGAISFQTAAELEEGALAAAWGPQRRLEKDRILSTLLQIHSSDAVVDRYAEIRVARHRQPISVPDAWIVATALAFGLELVTHNPSDFQGIPGLVIITEAP